jgi:peptide/nickel transport system substrate-binding protein
MRSIFRRTLALLLVPALAMALPGCRDETQGTPRVIVIGAPPKLRDPAQVRLSASDAVLVQNVAQGLVAFDPSGNIVRGLAERWNVSDDGLSYIFRIASAQWADGRKITAQQVARLVKRQLGPRSKNPMKDPLGVVQDVVAMTDRVIEIRLAAPRPNLLALLAQPEMAILRDGRGTGPFTAAAERGPDGELRLVRGVLSGDGEDTRREELLLTGKPVEDAVREFASDKAQLVLGGTFADLPYATRVKLPRGSVRFDPASGLFGLVPVHPEGKLRSAEARRLLSQAIDRNALVAALRVPNLAPRATVLEPGLDGVPAPAAPAWFGTPLFNRFPGLQDQAMRLFGTTQTPTIRVALPEGPGADLLLQRLQQDWGALGLTVERAPGAASADFALVDEVAPSSSPAWFVRRFRCEIVPLCDAETDELLAAARQTLVPAQRYALLAQAAARIDDAQLFIPLTAPVRWSLVSTRIRGFAGNRYARHTLSNLEQRPGSED